MLRVFCDNCGGPSPASPSKVFDALSRNIGLEVTVTYDGVTGPDHHLCDDCFAELLIGAAKTLSGTATIAKHAGFLAQATDYTALETRLNEKEERLASVESDLKKKTAAIADLEKKLRAEMAENDDKRRVAEAKLAAVASSAETRIRRAVADAIQNKSDQVNDPAYLDAVRARQEQMAKPALEVPKVIPVVIEGEDPEYVEAVRKREAIRASSRR